LSTWMVVEDEPDIYEVLLAMFEVWGIEGVAFVDGSEATAWIEDVDAGRVQTDLPELGIIDIRLPTEISGSAVGANLRQSPHLKNITIVLITAYRLQPSEEDAVIAEAQADLLLYKPLPRPDEVRRVLEKALAKRAAIAAAEAAIASKATATDEATGTVEIESVKSDEEVSEAAESEPTAPAEPPTAPPAKTPSSSSNNQPTGGQ
jgi:CheY-like chemotaxis protein